MAGREDPTHDRGFRRTIAHLRRPSEARRGVHFEEQLSLSESSYAWIAKVARWVAVVSIVVMIIGAPLGVLAFLGFIAAVSGQSIVSVVTGLPPVFLLFLVGFVVFGVGGALVAIVGAFMWGGSSTKDEVHTRVTDEAVEIDREGGGPTRSSGVTIPLGAITRVEYNDPEGDFGMNLDDATAKKFLGGRSEEWVRIERSDGPTVFVGSDRKLKLADIVADLAPNVDGAQPFS